MVNRFSMKIFDASDSRKLLELLHGAYADDLSQILNKQLEKQRKEPYLLQIITYPQGNRCSPISVTRNIPISSVRQPISESVISNALRHPTHMSERWTLLITTVYKPPGLFVVCDQLIYNGGYLHEPRRDGSVYKRRVRSAPCFKLKKKNFHQMKSRTSNKMGNCGW